jgi:hypothetical protein
MKRIAIIFLILITVGCKNKSQSTSDIEIQETIKEEAKRDNQFKVIMEVTVKEDDKFQLFYIDDSPEGTFTPEKRVVVNLKGSDSSQKIQFRLPEKVLPYKFRIDLGENKMETIILINEIKLQYNDEKIVIDALVLERFFQPNMYLQKTENGYLRKTIEGRCDPFLVSTPLLIKKMELEL